MLFFQKKGLPCQAQVVKKRFEYEIDVDRSYTMVMLPNLRVETEEEEKIMLHKMVMNN